MSLPEPPVPIAPLQYLTPSGQPRPEIMSAVGIISIIIGSVSGLLSLVSTLSVIAMISWSRLATPTFGTPTSAPAIIPFRLTPAGHTMLLVESLLSLAAAAVLLLGGILLLNKFPKYLLLHWIYVFVKIPIAFLGAIVNWLNYRSVATMISKTITPSGISWNVMMLVPALISAMVVMAYAVCLIFILRSRTAREFFNRLRGIHG